jgi:RNA polymerase sigma-70 factor (ECF subfamily)
MTITVADEVQLIARARKGDTRAYGALVELHQHRIFGLVFRMVRDHGLAEELTQDVFVKAHRNLDGFRGSARLSTWLYRIAVNTCRDHAGSRRERERRAQTSIDDPALTDLEPVSGEPRPDSELEGRELEEAFAAALDRLDATYAEPFLLRHQEGRGYAEIAEILGISVANAKVRVHRAREMILSTLRDAGHAV